MAPSRNAVSYWVFQGHAMPDHLRGLAIGDEFPFRGRNNAERIRVGDVMLLWQSGGHAGIYGWGTVSGEAYSISPARKTDENTGRFRVPVRLERKLLRSPVLRSELRSRRATSNLSILTAPFRASFFDVTPTAIPTLKRLLERHKSARADERDPVVDPERGELQARRSRQGAKQFRQHLLDAYGRRCAISGCSVLGVLDACHIASHAETGSNSNTNGILLRTDLHSLFDDGLLRIDPRTLAIEIDESLNRTEYQAFDGQRLRTRLDRLRPDRGALTKKLKSLV